VIDQEIVSYTLRIQQQFDAFKLRLIRAQRSLENKMLWGEPVKPGQHHAGSLDLKGRGRKPVDLQFFKDLDDELEETETQPSRTNRQRKERNFGPFVTSKDTQQNGNEEDDDDDFESIPKKETNPYKAEGDYRRRVTRFVD